MWVARGGLLHALLLLQASLLLLLLLLRVMIGIDDARDGNCLLRLVACRGAAEAIHTYLVLLSQKRPDQLVHVERLLLKESRRQTRFSEGHLLVLCNEVTSLGCCRCLTGSKHLT